MNLMEKLIKMDAEKLEEREEGSYFSERLGRVLGESKAVEIKIREVEARRINEYAATQYTEDGKFDSSKLYDVKLMTCVAGIVEPDIKNEALQKHFKCHTPKQLVEKLFDYEIGKISDAIEKLGTGWGENTEKKLES